MKKNKKIDIKNLTLAGLEERVLSLGEKPYRARQIMGWVYQCNTTSFEEMTDLPEEFRRKIENVFCFNNFNTNKTETSRDGTHKFLFELKDSNCIESVLIPEKKHRTLCISTQVGCAMGCKFCFSGKDGLVRNLDASEIVHQVTTIKNDFMLKDETPNIVFMGMGEPLANYDNTLKALQILTSPSCFNLSPRRITVSTAGLSPQLERLGKELPVNLAISLNAANHSLRSYLMPINKKYPLDKLLKVASTTPLPSRKRITFEYILIHKVNDSLKDAGELASLLKGIRCKINLIPFNEHEGMDFKRPDNETVQRFRELLVSKHFTVLVRDSKGSDISAACGQLRHQATHR
jgi:23S rRNA (adenine2503-C2)-methyltransferase